MYEPKLTAYERRRINSQKIAQVQFHPTSQEKELPKSKHAWEEWKSNKLASRMNEVKQLTPLEQLKEEELWDE